MPYPISAFARAAAGLPRSLQTLPRGLAAGALALIVVLPAATPTRADVREGFEGRYQVGASRCSVRPVRMAFELRCPGRRLRHFFFDERVPGRTTYRSGGARAERFEFSDERRGTGRFFRADGAVLAVRRVAPAR